MQYVRLAIIATLLFWLYGPQALTVIAVLLLLSVLKKFSEPPLLTA